MILGPEITLALAASSATEELGAAIAPILRAGDVVLLAGPLGAGKSCLARGLIRALTRPDEEVPSPTFTLVQTYEAVVPLAHLDLYRLSRPEEVEELGLDEWLQSGAAAIEWPDRLGPRHYPDRLDIDMSIVGEGRVARLRAHGSFEGRWLEFRT